MNKKDVLELKKRFTKKGCTFTKMSGCYIDSEKNKVVTLQETFLNLEEEEFYKYLDIAKKTLSGNLNNNLLELAFPRAEEEAGGKQQFLMGLRESGLKNPDLVDRFFDLVIETYDYPGNYLILLFHDAYDVMKKTNDNMQLDESEEVYEYLLCAICPVTLSKAALGYREEENRIGSRIRDWVVGVPDSGFVFPAFTERSTDIHSVMFYTKDTKEPHVELMEDLLGCPSRRTATIQKNVFNNLMEHIIEEHNDVNEATLMDIQSELHDLVEEQEAKQEEDSLLLNTALLQNIMTESGVPEPVAQAIEEAYEEEFAKEPPAVEFLVDKKTMEANAKFREQQAFANQIQALKDTIEEKNTVIEEKDAIIEQKDLDLLNAGETDAVTSSPSDVILKVNPERVEQISSQMIDGQRCLVIPLDDSDHVKLNGVEKTVEEL